jgi:adenylosuccinate synthase
MGKLRIVLLSGPFKVGKSTITGELVQQFGFLKISSGDYLRSLNPDVEQLDIAQARLLLQEAGDALDRQTDFLWVVDPVATSTIANAPYASTWLFDAVRKPRQVEHFREKFGSAVLHVHLTAPDDVLRSRSGLNETAFITAIAHSNEVNSRSLGDMADRLFDTTSFTAHEIATQIAQAGG